MSQIVILYNIYFEGVKLNTRPPMPIEAAKDYLDETVRNYGYRPEMRPVPIKSDIECPICKTNENVRLDYDNPQTMVCCDKCGIDMCNDGEIILDPRKL